MKNYQRESIERLVKSLIIELEHEENSIIRSHLKGQINAYQNVLNVICPSESK